MEQFRRTSIEEVNSGEGRRRTVSFPVASAAAAVLPHNVAAASRVLCCRRASSGSPVSLLGSHASTVVEFGAVRFIVSNRWFNNARSSVSTTSFGCVP